MTAVLISLAEISPPPILKRPTTLSSYSGRAALITGSLYKRKLETSVALKDKTNSETIRMLFYTNNEVPSCDDDGEDEGQDAECLYCSRLF
ncbi:hypothetical protein C0J52_03324 [Blattella germanica]|nr:hypothetical protein C0J52_03324 [Blattella germanica]